MTDTIGSNKLHHRIHLNPEYVANVTQVQPDFSLFGKTVYLRTYSRTVLSNEKERRETWAEIIQRVTEYSFDLHIGDDEASINREANELFSAMYHLRGFPAGRTLWIGGTDYVDPSNPKGTALASMNCAFTTVDRPEDIYDIVYLLMNGTGVGFSATQESVENLTRFAPVSMIKPEVVVMPYSYLDPEILQDSTRDDSFYIFENGVLTMNIGDSREAWAMFIRDFVVAYLTGSAKHTFDAFVGDASGRNHKRMIHLDDRGDYCDNSIKQIVINADRVRPYGAVLKTFGGTASGPDPLFDMIHDLQNLVENEGFHCWTDTLINDIITMSARATVSGGKRRSALISCGDNTSEAFANMKTGEWYNTHPWRSQANNSQYYYSRPEKSELLLRLNQALVGDPENGVYPAGEPGMFNMEEARRRKGNTQGFNPCGEILLKSKQTCNLVEINLVAHLDSDSELGYDKETLFRTARLMARHNFRITNIDFSREMPKWDKVQKEDRLCGVALSGMMDFKDALNWDNAQMGGLLKELRDYVIEVVNKYADDMKVNRSALVTTVKPSGCRPWNALTTTDKGLITLEEMFVDHDESKEWDEYQGEANAIQQKDTSNKITKTYNNGKAEVFAIRMSYGLTVESTANHQWFAMKPNGKHRQYGEMDWYATSDLKAGDVLKVKLGTYKNEIPAKLRKSSSLSVKMREDTFSIKQPEEMNSDLAWLLGYLWGDGAMSPVIFRFRWVDARIENLEKAKRIIFEQFGIECNYKQLKDGQASSMEFGSKALWFWMIKNGVFKYDADKIELIPEVVRRSSWRHIVAFIAGLIDADGWAGITGTGRDRSVTLATADKRFSQHVQDVCWAIGIAFGRSENTRGENLQKRKSMWLMSMANPTRKNALDELLKHSLKMQGTSGPRWRHDDGEGKFNRRIGRIESIESVGIQGTYDIEVENEHYYYAGSVLSHNSISLIPGVSPGAHPPIAPYFWRRIRIGKNDGVAKALAFLGVPYEAEMHEVRSRGKSRNVDTSGWTGNEQRSIELADTLVFSFPAKSRAKKAADQYTALEQLDFYKMTMQNWTQHNTSITIYVEPHEVEQVADWMLENWNDYVGISFLPKNGGVYEQAPYEAITQQQYQDAVSAFPDLADLEEYLANIEASGVNFSDIQEMCEGGNCPTR
jgi:ribonucleoside-diphosphate reductase alpha chain